MAWGLLIYWIDDMNTTSCCDHICPFPLLSLALIPIYQFNSLKEPSLSFFSLITPISFASTYSFRLIVEFILSFRCGWALCLELDGVYGWMYFPHMTKMDIQKPPATRTIYHLGRYFRSDAELHGSKRNTNQCALQTEMVKSIGKVHYKLKIPYWAACIEISHWFILQQILPAIQWKSKPGCQSDNSEGNIRSCYYLKKWNNIV